MGLGAYDLDFGGCVASGWGEVVYSDVSRWFLDCLRCDVVVVIWLRCRTFMFRV